MFSKKSIRLGPKRWILAGLALVALLLSVELAWLANPSQLKIVTRFNNLLYDARFALLPPKRSIELPIVIVDLDEDSIQQEGRWPWDRAKIADLVHALQNNGAGLIGLDIIFSEPSRNPAQQVLEQADLPDSIRNALELEQDRFDSDLALAKALGANTVPGYFFQNDTGSAGQLPFPFYQLSKEQQEHNRLLTMNSYTGSLPVLANRAIGQGFVVAVPDLDGVVRRVPLVIRHENEVYASLSLVLAQFALGAPWLKLGLVNNGHEWVATDINIGNQVQVPLSADGSLLVPYKGYAKTFTTVPATRVLQNTLTDKERELINGGIVLVGTSALGLSDLRTIPLQTSYPGVEVHANVLDAILQASLGAATFYQYPDWAPAASLLLLLVIGVLLAFLLPGRSPQVMLAMALLSGLGVVGLNAWFWQQMHLALPLFMQLLLVLLLSSFNLAVGFFETNRNKREIQNLFGAYVPPAHVEQILANPEAATMEGEQRNMTVLFADVIGFTALSEALTTAELKELLNRYLTEVTHIIFAHQGTIDKYVGDMVMAFWNAPLHDANHAQNGVLTALAMQEKVNDLKAEFIKDGLPPIAVGIGLNTGLMNVGDMGSSYRRAYTVLGDAVNLGSRLEGLTRFYGAEILVSDETRKHCPDVLFRRLDRIQVKGKNEPVDVFEPLCRKSQATEKLLLSLESFEEALNAYQAQNFAQAKALLEKLIVEDELLENKRQSRALLYQRYLERIAEFEITPPPLGWAAVFVHTSK